MNPMTTLYHWLWTLLPGNPIVMRIVQGGSRRQRHQWVRMGYLGGLIAIVLVTLLAGSGLEAQVSLNELAKKGAGVFEIIAKGQVILVCLLAPLFMAGAIGQEQAGKTYDILLTTPLSNLQIVLGSLAGRLFFILVLLASGLPLFSVLLIFGGVPVGSVFVSFAVAALTALVVGAMAVMLSVLRAGGRKAVFLFVIAVAAYLVCSYSVDRLLLRGGSGLTATHSTTWLTPLHPMLVLESSLSTENYRPPSPEVLGAYPGYLRFYLGRPLATFAVLCGVIGGGLILCSAVMVRRVGEGSAGLVRWSWLRRRLRLGVGGGQERRRAARGVWANPIAWREASTRGNRVGGILARWGFTAVGVAAGALLLGLYHFEALPALPGGPTGTLKPYETFGRFLAILLIIELVVVTLVAVYMSAGCVSREREDGTLDLILTTPVTPRQYIWGKLRGLVSFLIVLLAVPVVTLVMVSVYSVIGSLLGWEAATVSRVVVLRGGLMVKREAPLLLIETPLLLAAVIVPFLALSVMVGMSWSLKSKGVLGAVVPAVGIIGAVVMVTGLCGLNASQNLPWIGPVLNGFSPVTNLIMLLDPWANVKDFAEDPVLGRVSMAVAAVIAGSFYGFIVYSMQVAMVKGFDHTVRRLSGTG